jgi:hypothetical protein
VATSTTGLAADVDPPADVQGSNFGAVVQLQNDETNPVLRPEAK